MRSKEIKASAERDSYLLFASEVGVGADEVLYHVMKNDGLTKRQAEKVILDFIKRANPNGGQRRRKKSFWEWILQ